MHTSFSENWLHHFLHAPCGQVDHVGQLAVGSQWVGKAQVNQFTVPAPTKHGAIVWVGGFSQQA